MEKVLSRGQSPNLDPSVTLASDRFADPTGW